MARYQRDRLTWLAYLLISFFSYYLNILGPITPFLKTELNLNYTLSSLHFTAFAVGILITGLAGHKIIARMGRWIALWVGAFGLSSGGLLLIFGRIPAVTIAGSFIMGLVGSLILVIVPAALSDRHGPLRAVALSEANVIASSVATAAPLLVGWFAGSGLSWRWALGGGAILPLLIRLGLGKVEVPQAAESAGTPVAKSGNARLWYLVYWLAIALAVSAEICMISWSADFLVNVAGMSKASSAQAVSLFLAAMIVGRWAGSRLVQRIAASLVVVLSVCLAGAGFLLFWLSSIVSLTLAGLFITGLGIANLYPLLVSLSIEVATDTVGASARATLASGTAILALPLTVGRLADIAGIWQAYGVMIFLLVGILLIILVTRSVSASRISR